MFRILPRRSFFLAPLLVAVLAIGVGGWSPLGVGPFGLETVSANSRCHQHYNHTHWFGLRTDAWDSHGTTLRPSTNQLWHWIDHENSNYKWCFRDENQNGIDD